VISFLDDQPEGEVLTGLLYIDESAPDMHELNQTTATPLNQVPFEKLCPGSVALSKLQEEFR
jgi:2-oxoglutarate ferredoxin oxidoreductase subunit beta